MAFCEECGMKLEDGVRFCANCGHETAVEAELVNETQPVAVEPVIQAAEELVGTVVHDIDAPSTIGENTLCTWKNAGAGALPAEAVSAATKAAGAVAQQAGAKKSKAPIIMIAVGAVILVAVFALYVAPRFIFHPVDPNEHTALTSSSSQSVSASASSAAVSSSAASSTSSASSASAESSSSSAEASSSTSTPSSESASASSSAVGPMSYSTDERPKVSEFKWVDGEVMKGNAPADAKRIVDFGELVGGWKGYMSGNGSEWLFSAYIEPLQAGPTITISWYYVRQGGSGDGQEDNTPDSTFTGTFDGGMLDAVGSGRVTLTAFWEKDGHQYAAGSFMWPSGETGAIALVRP